VGPHAGGKGYYDRSGGSTLGAEEKEKKGDRFGAKYMLKKRTGGEKGALVRRGKRKKGRGREKLGRTILCPAHKF